MRRLSCPICRAEKTQAAQAAPGLGKGLVLHRSIGFDPIVLRSSPLGGCKQFPSGWKLCSGALSCTDCRHHIYQVLCLVDKGCTGVEVYPIVSNLTACGWICPPWSGCPRAGCRSIRSTDRRNNNTMTLIEHISAETWTFLTFQSLFALVRQYPDRRHGGLVSIDHLDRPKFYNAPWNLLAKQYKGHARGPKKPKHGLRYVFTVQLVASS